MARCAYLLRFGLHGKLFKEAHCAVKSVVVLVSIFASVECGKFGRAHLPRFFWNFCSSNKAVHERQSGFQDHVLISVDSTSDGVYLESYGQKYHRYSENISNLSSRPVVMVRRARAGGFQRGSFCPSLATISRLFWRICGCW